MKRSIVYAVFLSLCASGVSSQTSVSFIPYREAKPIVEALSEIAPLEIRDVKPSLREQVWDAWVIKRDREIRKRLSLGDADSVINFLLFGTSFTAAPRLTGAQLKLLTDELEGHPMAAVSSVHRVLEQRAGDLIRGTVSPGSNERLDFVRKTMEANGIRFTEKDALTKAAFFLHENEKRVLREQEGYAQALAEAKSLNDATEEFAEVSKLYKDRGLSLDTSLPPNFAIEAALKDMLEKQLVGPNGVKRIGIIGPGLDFTDKQEGFDFYPVQTVQPFAVVDSLLRLGLSDPEDLDVDILDLSPRVLRHVERIAAAGAKGQGYVLQIPMDRNRNWQPELVTYWQNLGDRIGSPVKPTPPPSGMNNVVTRAIRVQAALASRLKALKVNVVLQRAASALPGQGYDLLIATNVFVYYETFEQCLALANIAAMLKPGGYLLTNNLLLELPDTMMQSQGHTVSSYYTNEEGGDTIVRYKRR